MTWRPQRSGRAVLGGVPTVVGAPAEVTEPRQLAFALGDDVGRQPSVVLPGVVHIPDWLDAEQQRDLAAEFRWWALPPAGLRHPRVPTGHLMSVQSVCLGWHWYPYVYSRTADDTDGAPVKPLPADLANLSKRAVAAAHAIEYPGDAPPEYAPDAAIVNLYAPDAHLGLHQDGEEPSEAPVVTLTLGDSCTFRMTAVHRRVGPFTDVEFRSGDLLVFGGENRRIFHGVPKVVAGSGPDDLGLPPGRVSITVRETGLAG